MPCSFSTNSPRIIIAIASGEELPTCVVLEPSKPYETVISPRFTLKEPVQVFPSRSISTFSDGEYFGGRRTIVLLFRGWDECESLPLFLADNDLAITAALVCWRGRMRCRALTRCPRPPTIAHGDLPDISTRDPRQPSRPGHGRLGVVQRVFQDRRGGHVNPNRPPGPRLPGAGRGRADALLLRRLNGSFQNYDSWSKLYQ